MNFRVVEVCRERQAGSRALHSPARPPVSWRVTVGHSRGLSSQRGPCRAVSTRAAGSAPGPLVCEGRCVLVARSPSHPHPRRCVSLQTVLTPSPHPLRSLPPSPGPRGGGGGGGDGFHPALVGVPYGDSHRALSLLLCVGPREGFLRESCPFPVPSHVLLTAWATVGCRPIPCVCVGLGSVRPCPPS